MYSVRLLFWGVLCGATFQLGCISDSVERISEADLTPVKGRIRGEQEFEKDIVLAKGIKMRARIDVTNKGNGTLRIGNLCVKVFDGHCDGCYDEAWTSNIDFVDLDGDGKKDLVISRVACFTDDKGDEVLHREAVVLIYALQPDRTFKRVYSNVSKSFARLWDWQEPERKEEKKEFKPPTDPFFANSAVLTSWDDLKPFADSVDRISRTDLKPAEDGMPGEKMFEKNIALANGIKMQARIDVTPKGIGYLQIGNLNVKVFDSHKDGGYYENEMLNIDFVDIAGDGKKDLVISGIACYTGEKDDSVLCREAVVLIYTLLPDLTFKQVYSAQSWSLARQGEQYRKNLIRSKCLSYGDM